MPNPSVSQMETWQQFLLSWSFLSVLQGAVPPPVCKFLLLTFTNESNPNKEPQSGTVLWFHNDILLESKLLLQWSVLPLLVSQSFTEAASEMLKDTIFSLCVFCNVEM